MNRTVQCILMLPPINKMVVSNTDVLSPEIVKTKNYYKKLKEHYPNSQEIKKMLVILHYGKKVKKMSLHGNLHGVLEDLVGILNVLLWQQVF